VLQWQLLLAALAAHSLLHFSHLWLYTLSPLNSLILLSHNASIYRHFMAAVLALLSTLVAAKLQLIQQWWLPIVNGWCQPFAAHAMATTQQT
jgi:hypothetical protein